MSWPSWLICSGRFTHVSGHPSAAGHAQDRESSPARDRRSTTVPRHQLYNYSCSVLYLRKQKIMPQVNLVFGNNTVPQVNSARNLVVIVDSRLKFDIHINHIVTRAHRLANLIHKCFISRDPPTLMRPFVTYVRPY